MPRPTRQDAPGADLSATVAEFLGRQQLGAEFRPSDIVAWLGEVAVGESECAGLDAILEDLVRSGAIRATGCSSDPRYVVTEGFEDCATAALARCTAETPQLRPSVEAFALEMERVLRRHDPQKGGQSSWREEGLLSMLVLLREEVGELAVAIHSASPDHLRRVAEESIDVANIAMMIHDIAKPLAEDPEVRS